MLYALGIVLTIQANIGYAPWDVFHAGFSQITGLSFGISSIIIGIAIIATVCLFKEKIGIGTVLNMVLIGIYIDLLQHFKIIPQSANIYMGLLEMARRSGNRLTYKFDDVNDEYAYYTITVRVRAKGFKSPLAG